MCKTKFYLISLGLAPSFGARRDIYASASIRNTIQYRSIHKMLRTEVGKDCTLNYTNNKLVQGFHS